MKKGFWIVLIGSSILASCKKNLPDVGGTAAQPMANEWWVTYTVNGVDTLGLGHIKIATYNASANTNELWIDDLGNGAPGYLFKVNTTADFNAFTFAAPKAVNQSYVEGGEDPQTITITNGKILPRQGHSKTGKVTDSIYMQAEITGTTFTISGYARTMWAEDDY